MNPNSITICGPDGASVTLANLPPDIMARLVSAYSDYTHHTPRAYVALPELPSKTCAVNMTINDGALSPMEAMGVLVLGVPIPKETTP